MSRPTGASDAELGARLALALERRVDDIGMASAPHLDRVRAGARRRRRNVRAAIGAACATALAITGAAIALRTMDDTAPAAPTTTVPAPAHVPLLPAYAMLTDDTGDRLTPARMWAERGGAPNGTLWPAVDVWQRGDERLIVRTFDRHVADADQPSDAPNSTSAAPATTAVTDDSDGRAPWPETDVGLTTVRGVAGATRVLARDQSAVWVPGNDDAYTLVIGRGLATQSLLAEVDAMTIVNGRLAPPSGFELVESAAARLENEPRQPSAGVEYGEHDDVSLSTSAVADARRSLETAAWFQLGAIEQIRGRDVMVSHEADTVRVAFIDPTGLLVTARSTGRGDTADTLMSRVELVDDVRWQSTATALSEQLLASSQPIDAVELEGVELSRREGPNAQVVMCVAVDSGSRRCLLAPHAGASDAVNGHVEIDGQWLAFGYAPLTSDWASTSRKASFTDPTGRVIETWSTLGGDGYWYVARIPGDVDVVNAEVSNPAGGYAGPISRPYVATSA